MHKLNLSISAEDRTDRASPVIILGVLVIGDCSISSNIISILEINEHKKDSVL